MPSPTPNDSSNVSPAPNAPASPNPPASTTPASTLTPDQQKIQAAANKQAAAQSKDDKGRSGKPIKPLFTEPPRGVIDADFQISDTDRGIIDMPDGPPVEPPKTEPKVEKPEPPKKEEPKAQPDINGKPTTKVDVKASEGSKRDYTGFSPEETEHLKQMSKPAFEFVAKQLKDFKTLQQQKGNDNYYQHPDAYQLTPEFKKINEDINFLSKERDHWKQQLLNIRNAKPWFGLQGFDDKGNIITSGPYKATDEAELDVSNVFNMAHSKIGEFFGQRQQLQQNFKQRVDQDIAAIQRERQVRFEWARDTTKLEEKVNIPEIGDVPIKTIRDDFRNMWPAYMHSSPLMDVTCDMFASVQVLAARVRELEKGVKTEQALKEDVIRGEPNIDGGNQDVNGKSEKDFVFTDDAI